MLVLVLLVVKAALVEVQVLVLVKDTKVLRFHTRKKAGGGGCVLAAQECIRLAWSPVNSVNRKERGCFVLSPSVCLVISEVRL